MQGTVVHSLDSHQYFACTLERILTLDALGAPEPDAYLKTYTQRHADLLTCLTNSRDERLTYDLRLIARPDLARVSRGRLTLALLCRMDQTSVAEADQYAHSLHHLLRALFEEYVFDLAAAEQIPALLEPFPFTHAVVVRRRAGLERLDTLKIRPAARPLGFNTQPTSAAAAPPPQNVIFHLFPFLPTWSAFTALIKLLLLEPHPVAISCRLRPTTLTPAEEAFIEEQIARCECATQAGLSNLPDDLSALQPTLREQAQMYQRYQARLLFGLKDNAGLMTLSLASPSPIAVPLADTLGALVTQPAGGTQGGNDDLLHRYLAGGYELSDCSGDQTVIDAFRRLDMVTSPRTDVPREAERLPALFDAVEAAAAFRFPPATHEIPPGLEVQFWRTRPAPRNVLEEGCLIGVSADQGATQSIRIGREDRRRHVYLVGQTGTGKTTLLKTMILDDMRAGAGLCVIDPHGDLFHELLAQVPAQRADEVVVLDPTETSCPVGLNMLEFKTESQRHFLVQEFVGIITRLMEDEYGAAAGEMMGTMFFQHMRMNLLLAMSNPPDPGTLLEFYTIFQQKDYWRRWLPVQLPDPVLERWVKHVLPQTDYTRPGSDGGSMGSYVSSKFEGFVFDPMLRRIFGQKHSTVNLREVMDSGKILLVNLAKGELTETNSRFLGMVLLAKLQAAAMGRTQIPQDQRRDFAVYVDEFQSIATQNFITLLSEARKFGLNLVLANQFVSQIKDTRITDAIFGNVGTLVSFRLGQADAEVVEKKLFPVFTRFDLVNLPNWHAYITTLINGEAVQPFNIETMVDRTPVDPARAEAVCARSRTAYGRPVKDVDAAIAESLRGPEDDE
jgi:hypothetical protein